MSAFSDYLQPVYFFCQLGKSWYWSGWTEGGAGKQTNIIKYIIAVELEV